MPDNTPEAALDKSKISEAESKPATATDNSSKKEIGGPKGLEPTRYGDWEQNGRCTDF